MPRTIYAYTSSFLSEYPTGYFFDDGITPATLPMPFSVAGDTLIVTSGVGIEIDIEGPAFPAAFIVQESGLLFFGNTGIGTVGSGTFSLDTVTLTVEQGGTANVSAGGGYVAFTAFSMTVNGSFSCTSGQLDLSDSGNSVTISVEGTVNGSNGGTVVLPPTTTWLGSIYTDILDFPGQGVGGNLYMQSSATLYLFTWGDSNAIVTPTLTAADNGARIFLGYGGSPIVFKPVAENAPVGRAHTVRGLDI